MTYTCLGCENIIACSGTYVTVTICNVSYLEYSCEQMEHHKKSLSLVVLRLRDPRNERGSV